MKTALVKPPKPRSLSVLLTDAENLRAEADLAVVAMRADRLRAAADRLETLEETDAKLPKCWRLNEDGKRVQDVSVVPGMVIYRRNADGSISQLTTALRNPGLHCYYSSTREAAEAEEPAHA